jgi:hypothetical protein
VDPAPLAGASGVRGAPVANPVPRGCVSGARSAAAAPSRAVSTGWAGVTGVLACRSPSASFERASATFSVSFSSGVSTSVSVDLPTNRLKKLNMVCSGGGGAFYRCRRNRVPASNERRTQTTRKREGDDGCRAAKDRRKQREEPGVCAKKSERHVFYQPAPIVVSGPTENPCIGRGGAVVTCPHRRQANCCKPIAFSTDPRGSSRRLYSRPTHVHVPFLDHPRTRAKS